MDKNYKTYTIIAWFFTLNIAWVLLNEFVLPKLLYSHVRTTYGIMVNHPRYGLGFMLVYGFVHYSIQAAWCVMLALLAWTARSDYLSKARAFETPVAGPTRMETADGQAR